MGLIDEEALEVLSAAADPSVTAEHRDTIRRAVSALDDVERQIVLGRARQDYHLVALVRDKQAVDRNLVRRADRRMRQRMRAAADLSEAAPPTIDPVDLAVYVKRLSKKEALVLNLAFEGYWPAAIAQILRISPNNARVTLHHAKTALVAMLPNWPAGWTGWSGGRGAGGTAGPTGRGRCRTGRAGCQTRRCARSASAGPTVHRIPDSDSSGVREFGS